MVPPNFVTFWRIFVMTEQKNIIKCKFTQKKKVC